ncbi:MAG TPA: hypothetical protein PJ982_02555 [Lacipirellulaceae bacterium]|nr:hypothetical protein [Lacipirellulaceae bacterium]
MSANFARDQRRRRVLHDEARTTSAVAMAAEHAEDDGGETPRYGEMASIEHHPQISDYVPRRRRAVLLTLAAGGTLAAATGALHHFAADVASAIPGVSAQVVAERIAAGLAAWTGAVALLAVAGLARLVFSLRRHRVDDVRGRYRVWRWVAWGSLALSANAVVGLHAIAGQAAVVATGWSLSPAGAEWWLIPLALIAAWIGVRLAPELAESKASLAMLAAAGLWYLAAAAGATDLGQGWFGGALAVIASAALLLGHFTLLAAMMLYARYVVLDVQGLVDHAPRRRQQTSAPSAAAFPAQAAATGASAAATDDWSDAEDAAEDDIDLRSLSKSERKRLRKQQRRAA